MTLEDALPPVPLLFGEAQGRIVVSCDPGQTESVLETARRHGVPAKRIGRVTAGEEGIRVTTGEYEIRASSHDAERAFRDALPDRMDRTLTADAE